MKIFLKVAHLFDSTYMKQSQNLHALLKSRLYMRCIHLHNKGANGHFSSRTRGCEIYTPAPSPKHDGWDFWTQNKFSIPIHQELRESVPKHSSQCRWPSSKAPAGTEQWQIVQRGIDLGSNKAAKDKSYMQLCSRCKGSLLCAPFISSVAGSKRF